MRMSHTVSSFFVVDPVSWSADWAWGLPLIVLTVLIHVSCLGLISQTVAHGTVGHMAGRLHSRWHS
jgi:hypothetical protein